MSFRASARWYRSALRNSSETGSPPMALRESTSSRMRLRYSLERLNWSRSAARTGLPPARSISWAFDFDFDSDAATRTGTYQVTARKSRGFPGGRAPGGEAARGEEGVEDKLGRAGQRAQVTQRGRQQGGRRGPAEA